MLLRSSALFLAFAILSPSSSSAQPPEPAFSTETVFPSHFRRAQPNATARARLVGAIYWNQGRGCQRWVFRRAPAGFLQLRRTTHVRYPGVGVREETSFYNFEEEFQPDGRYLVYNVGGTERWISRVQVRGLHVHPASGGASGGLFSIAFVRVAHDRMIWVEGPSTSLTAYDPRRAHGWYRTLALCRERTE